MSVDLSKIPPSTVIQNTINQLSNADLSKTSYEKIYNSILKGIGSIPVPIISFPKGKFIQRARINNGQSLFYSESEISYRTDTHNITKWGRANRPFQSIFYGACYSSEVDEPTVTLLCELNELLRNKDRSNSADFYITVGLWEVIEDLTLGMVINDITANVISEIRHGRDKFYGDLKKNIPNRYEDLISVFRFFINEFSKSEIKTHLDYKISTAFTHIVLQNPDVDGIVYPSVRTEFENMNIALIPFSVERKMRLAAAGIYHVRKKKDKVVFEPYAGTKDFGSLNSKFSYTFYEKSMNEFFDSLDGK